MKFYAHVKEDISSRYSYIKDQYTASDKSSNSYITEDIWEAIASNDFYNINLYLEGIKDEWVNEWLKLR